MVRLGLLVLLIVFAFTSQTEAQKPTREEKVRSDRARIEGEGFWIYNDLKKGFQEAALTGKPLLVVLRCIPCEECVKLDDDLLEEDPEIQKLLKEYVCVRQVSTNGIDLSIFQYDTDQSFAVFLLNADGTIYGRYGTRSHRTDWEDDVSITGLEKALEKGLELHDNYPENKAALAGKTGPKPLFASPEQYPLHRDKFTDKINYAGDVVRSCIHCHQIGDAERAFYRSAGKPIPEKVLFPYPHPKALGLVLDPETLSTVKSVEPGTIAEKSGLQQGDKIQTLNGQPILSIADIQWVLHQTSPDGGEVTAAVQRDGVEKSLTISLPKGWRRLDDIGWRVSSWPMRRMALGGLKLEEVPAEEKRRLKIAEDKMALRVAHVGQYGPHAAAKRAGFQKEDIIVEYDGRNDLLRDGDLLAYGVTARKPGEKVSVTILRNGRRLTKTLPMQE
ncbi:MAG: PDZ domain-containing protein [Planctomycetaceae bacterium]|nr:PDZ domain-containing protein [Planctomycetaceae bacterium]